VARHSSVGTVIAPRGLTDQYRTVCLLPRTVSRAVRGSGVPQSRTKYIRAGRRVDGYEFGRVISWLSMSYLDRSLVGAGDYIAGGRGIPWRS